MWRLFLAVVLIVVGAVILLVNLQLVTGNPWSYALPAILILLGILVLVSVRRRSKPLQVETGAEPLNDATQASVLLRHGIGRLHVRGGVDAALLYSGSWTGGVSKNITRANGQVSVTLTTPSELWQNLDPSRAGAVEWNIALHPGVALALRYEGGAADARLDLAETRLTSLELDNGASPVDVILPVPHGTLSVMVRAPAAPVILRLPPMVPATIRGTMPPGPPNIDASRFPHRGFGVHQSADYATATDRISIAIEPGVGSVQIR
jgi:hypothetical protein